MSSAGGFLPEERQQRHSGPNSQTPGRQASGRATLAETADWKAGSQSTLQSPLSPSPTPSGGIVVRPWRQQGGRNTSSTQSTPARGKSSTQDSANQTAESSLSSQSSGGVPLYPKESSNNLQLSSASRNEFNDDSTTAESRDNQNRASQSHQVALIFC